MALRIGMCTAMNSEMLAKLEVAGISSAAEFVSRDPETLSKEINVAYKDVCSIRRVLLAECSAYPVSAWSLYQNALSSLAILSTGCPNLDELLDGGLYTGEVTELAGDSATGKTRICHWCAAATVRDSPSSVLYVDICGAFQISTLLEAVSDDGAGNDNQEIIQSLLSRIKCAQVFDVFQLFSLLDRVMSDLREQKPTCEWSGLKLVVVEDLPLFIYPIMGTHAPYNQGILSRLGMTLKQLADSFSIAVLVTNNLVSLYGQGRVDQRKAALGRVWSHVPHTRFTLSRVGSGNATFPRPTQVEARLVKSSRQHTPCAATFDLVRGNGSV